MYHVNHYTLPDLVDLALKSPERGAVNFNMLHLVLKCMLKELGIEHVRPWCQTENPQLMLAAHTKLKLEEKIPPDPMTPPVRKATSAPESSLYQKPQDPKQPPIEFQRDFTIPEATFQKQKEKPVDQTQVQQQPTVESLQASTPPEATTEQPVVEEPPVPQQGPDVSVQALIPPEAPTTPPEAPTTPPEASTTPPEAPTTPPEAPTTSSEASKPKEEPLDESMECLHAALFSEEAFETKDEGPPVAEDEGQDELHTRRVDAGWGVIVKEVKHSSFKKKDNKKADLQDVDQKVGRVEEAWRYSHLRTTVDAHEETIMRHNEILDTLVDRIKRLESKRRQAAGGPIGGPVGGPVFGRPGIGRAGTGRPGIGGAGTSRPGIGGSGTGGPGVDGSGTGGLGIDGSRTGGPGIDGSGFDGTGFDGFGFDEMDTEKPFDLIADLDELEERIVSLEEARDVFERDHERLNTASRLLERVLKEFKEIKGMREKAKQMEIDLSSKISKGEMDESLDKKADRALVDSKVDRIEFETAIDELGEAITLLRLKFQKKVDEWEDLYKELWESLNGKMTREIFDEAMVKMEGRVVALMRALAMIKKLVDEALFPDAGGISRCMSCKRPAKESGRELLDEIATKRLLKSSESSSKDSPQGSQIFEGSRKVLKEASTIKPKREEPPYPIKNNISIYIPSPPDFLNSPSPDVKKNSSDVPKSSKRRFTSRNLKGAKSEPLKFTNMKLDKLKREKYPIPSLDEEHETTNTYEPPEMSLVTDSYKSASAMSIVNESTKDFKFFVPTQYRKLMKQDDVQNFADT